MVTGPFRSGGGDVGLRLARLATFTRLVKNFLHDLKDPINYGNSMVHSLLWVMQDVYHQQ